MPQHDTAQLWVPKGLGVHWGAGKHKHEPVGSPNQQPMDSVTWLRNHGDVFNAEQADTEPLMAGSPGPCSQCHPAIDYIPSHRSCYYAEISQSCLK